MVTREHIPSQGQFTPHESLSSFNHWWTISGPKCAAFHRVEYKVIFRSITRDAFFARMGNSEEQRKPKLWIMPRITELDAASVSEIFWRADTA